MKKILILITTALLIAPGVFAASFNIDENKDENLSGVEKIVFDLRWPNCAICISTGNQSYSFTGGGRAGNLSLSLEGDLRSNNKKAVPSIITEHENGTLYVRLFKERNLFFGLVQSGSVYLHVDLPSYFDGDVTISTASGDSIIAGLNL